GGGDEHRRRPPPLRRQRRLGSGLEGSGLDEAAADRVPRQLDAVAHAELLEDVRAMALDGLLADRQLGGDLAVDHPLGDQLDDLELAGGEQVLRDRTALAGALEVLPGDRPDLPRVEERLAAEDRPAGADEVAVGGGLEDVAGRTD